jgi:hypothetical protein
MKGSTRPHASHHKAAQACGRASPFSRHASCASHRGRADNTWPTAVRPALGERLAVRGHDQTSLDNALCFERGARDKSVQLAWDVS